jgi:hypothetical protein
MRWLRDDLEGNKGKVTVILVHHNIIPFHPRDEEVWANFLLDNNIEFMKLVESYPDVKLVISGHHHLAQMRSFDGISYFSCPSLISWPCAYTVFRIDGGKLEVTVDQIEDESLIEEARRRLLGDENLRKLFPGERTDEILRLFFGYQEVEVDLLERTPFEKEEEKSQRPIF